MTSGKWLRRALLGGVALGTAAIDAQAEELAGLKAQLEALQSRVNQLESAPAAATVPDGASLITFKQGQGSLGDWNVDRKSGGRIPQDSGFTIAITPSADVPAPVTEISVSGYVKGDVIYDFDQDNLGDTFTAGSAIDQSAQRTPGARLQARQTRFRIRSKTDTAIGQIRTLIEGDFFRLVANASVFRLRHAWGEWDMTPNWTFGAGQFWRVGCDVFSGVAHVEFGGGATGGSAGDCSNERAAQVRLTYTKGPVSWRFGIEEPFDPGGPGVIAGSRLSPDIPNVALAVLYNAHDGHQFFAGGTVSQVDYDRNENAFGDDKIGWVVQAGGTVKVNDFITLTGHFQYGDGVSNITGDGQNGHQPVALGNIITNAAWGGYAGLSLQVTDFTQFNIQYGHADGGCNTCSGWSNVNTVHANVIWSPVSQIRLGSELIYGWKRNTTAISMQPGRARLEDAVRGQFAAWFFF